MSKIHCAIAIMTTKSPQGLWERLNNHQTRWDCDCHNITSKSPHGLWDQIALRPNRHPVSPQEPSLALGLQLAELVLICQDQAEAPRALELSLLLL